jgi:UDP-N-acetylmuramoyl-tripeptide--D-alanyl-D-alanine ligase
MTKNKTKKSIDIPIPWTTAEILQATGGDLVCGEPQHSFAGISIDSRQINPEDLFIAIKGDVHDGHRFCRDVIAEGICGLLIADDKVGDLPLAEWKKRGIVCVAVNDTIRALGAIAAFNRQRTNISVIAITGSNGKTTTREMTGTVMAQRFCTLTARKNLNNEIGLPLTLLELTPRHQWAVLELGMNSPGEIGRLADICQPDIGVITNIGPAHLEGVGSIEGVMQAKGELLEKIKPGGTAVLNADDNRVMELARNISAAVCRFGLSQEAEIRALSVKEKEIGTSFDLSLPSERIFINLKYPGGFMVSNALAAAAIGDLVGLAAQAIKTGIETFRPVHGRLNILKTGQGVHLIDDSYNANPVSMDAAIQTLKKLRGKQRGVLVAGDMLELGRHSAVLHQKIGALAARSEIKRLYVTGNFAANVAAGAMEAGMKAEDIFSGSREEILEDLLNRIAPADWVLVKGSRGMRMEKIVEGLMRAD